jgi:hypothetical protein
LYRYYWPPKRLLILGSRYKGKLEGGKLRWLCDCVKCGKPLIESDIKVDHIDPVGPAPDLVPGCLGRYVDRLFCGVDNLQILCKECHDEKTKEDLKIIREQRKEINFNFKEKEIKCSANLISQEENRGKSKPKP